MNSTDDAISLSVFLIWEGNDTRSVLIPVGFSYMKVGWWCFHSFSVEASHRLPTRFQMKWHRPDWILMVLLLTILVQSGPSVPEITSAEHHCSAWGSFLQRENATEHNSLRDLCSLLDPQGLLSWHSGWFNKIWAVSFVVGAFSIVLNYSSHLLVRPQTTLFDRPLLCIFITNELFKFPIIHISFGSHYLHCVAENLH